MPAEPSANGASRSSALGTSRYFPRLSGRVPDALSGHRIRLADDRIPSASAGATWKNTSSRQPLGLGRGSSRGGFRFASMMSCPWPKYEQLGKFSQFDVGRDERE